MKPKTVLVIGVALGAAFLGVERLRTRAPAVPPQSLAGTPLVFAEGPVQTPTRAAPFRLGDFQIEPLAEFAVRARILAREDYRFDPESRLSPMDLALGWKRMADPAVYRALNITQGGRWYRYAWTQQPPLAVQEIIETSANMHMVPANAAVARLLGQAREGRTIALRGKLVQARLENGWRWTSSLTRTDTGAGSCELVYVEAVQFD